MKYRGDSITFNVISPEGYPCLYTLRQKEGEKKFNERVEETAKLLKMQEWKPNSNGKTYTKTTQPTKQLETCSKCGAQLTMGKSGKPYCVKCYIKWKESQNKEY